MRCYSQAEARVVNLAPHCPQRHLPQFQLMSSLRKSRSRRHSVASRGSAMQFTYEMSSCLRCLQWSDSLTSVAWKKQTRVTGRVFSMHPSLCGDKFRHCSRALTSVMRHCRNDSLCSDEQLETSSRNALSSSVPISSHQDRSNSLSCRNKAIVTVKNSPCQKPCSAVRIP